MPKRIKNGFNIILSSIIIYLIILKKKLINYRYIYNIIIKSH